MPGIEFRELAFRNAFSYENVKIPLAGQGLVLVTGANGAAKSALFQVLRHVALGSTARGMRGRAIVRAGSTGGYVARLRLGRAGHQYEVRQTQDHDRLGTGMAVLRDGRPIGHQRAKVRTQKMVADELIGLTAQQFDAGVVVAQRAAHPLVSGTGAECAAYLAQTFGLDWYDDARARVREAVQHGDVRLAGRVAVDVEVAAITERLTALGPEPAAAAAELAARSQRADALERALDGDLRTADQLVAAAERRADLEARAGPWAQRGGAALAARLQAVQDRLAASDARDQARQAAVERAARRAAVEARLHALPGPGPVPEAPDTATIDRLAGQRDDLVRAAGAADRLVDLDGHTQCPTCGQAVDAQHVQHEIDTGRRARDRLARLDDRLAGLRAQVRQHERAAAAARAQDVLRARLIGEREALGPDDQEPGTDDRHDRAVLAGQRDRLSAIVSIVRELEAGPPVDLEIVRTTRDDLVSRLARVRGKARELAVQAQAARRAAEEAARLTAQLAGAREAAADLARERREHECRRLLVKALARLKVRRLHEAVQAIQHVLPEYVAAMWPAGVSVEVDDQDPESIDRWLDRRGARVPVQALSDGEQARLRVAFVLAVRRLLSPEQTANLLVLDEADGGLDEAGLEQYGHVLEGLRGQYGSVFVVTHRKELSTVQFDQCWRVVRSGDQPSRLEVS